MKLALRIVLIVLLSLIALIFIVNEVIYTLQAHKYNYEPTNKNIRFVDKLGMHYWFGASTQGPDGSIYIVSKMSDRSWHKEYISIIKLAPNGNVQWETRTRIGKRGWHDLLPGNLAINWSTANITFSDIHVYKDNIFVFIGENSNTKAIPQIWKYDKEGKLLSKVFIKLDLAQDAISYICMVKDVVYLSLVPANSTLNLMKIDLNSGNVLTRDSHKTLAQVPAIESIITDTTDSTVYVSVVDGKVEGSYIYKYTQAKGFEDYYRTEPLHRFNNLRFINNKLLLTVKTDSLLEVIDITNPHKPVVMVHDKLSFPNWYASDLAMIDSNVYVCFSYASPIRKKKEDINADVMVRKYTPNGKQQAEFVIQGKKIEMYPQMYVMPDKQLIVLGSSFSTRSDKLMRVFATKFKL